MKTCDQPKPDRAAVRATIMHGEDLDIRVVVATVDVLVFTQMAEIARSRISRTIAVVAQITTGDHSKRAGGIPFSSVMSVRRKAIVITRVVIARIEIHDSPRSGPLDRSAQAAWAPMQAPRRRRERRPPAPWVTDSIRRTPWRTALW